MVYYVGGLMRATPEAGVTTSLVKVRPAGVYTDDTLPRGQRPPIPRTAPLFRITDDSARRRGDYAAAVRYRGVRYFAGPAISANCVITQPDCVVPFDGDRSAMVLSLLTQLVVLSQSNRAQEAPERVLVR
jgi:hypothetical protein